MSVSVALCKGVKITVLHFFLRQTEANPNSKQELACLTPLIL